MNDEEHEPDEAGQLALMPDLVRARARASKEQAAKKAKAPLPVDPAPELPVARVLVDVPLAHLDRPFDYLVPAKMHETVTAGSRVKVRFAGQDVDGFVLERVERSEHEGRLAPLRRAVSAEPVLSPAVARLSELVAARYAGTRSDVLRLAVPHRHATTEKQESATVPPAVPDTRRCGAGLVGVRRGSGVRAPARRRWFAARGLVLAARWHLARPCSRRRPPRRTPRGGARCCASPTTRTSPGSTGPWARSWAPVTTSCSPPTRAPPSATAPSWPCPAGRCGSWSAPAPQRSRRSATSAWSRSGTTGTTCTPSPGPPTRTPARCC